MTTNTSSITIPIKRFENYFEAILKRNPNSFNDKHQSPANNTGLFQESQINWKRKIT